MPSRLRGSARGGEGAARPLPQAPFPACAQLRQNYGLPELGIFPGGSAARAAPAGGRGCGGR